LFSLYLLIFLNSENITGKRLKESIRRPSAEIRPPPPVLEILEGESIYFFKVFLQPACTGYSTHNPAEFFWVWLYVPESGHHLTGFSRYIPASASCQSHHLLSIDNPKDKGLSLALVLLYHACQDPSTVKYAHLRNKIFKKLSTVVHMESRPCPPPVVSTFPSM
jgi:hypothetical protein